MKIRNQLLIVFISMTVFPLLLTLCCVSFILHRELDYCHKQYHINKNSCNDLDFLFNPLHFYYQVTLKEYQEAEAAIQKNPDIFLDSTYLKKFDKRLQEKNSYLVVLKGQEVVYKNKSVDTSSIPTVTALYLGEKDIVTYFDKKGASITKEKTFTFRDGSSGRILLVSDFTDTRNEWVSSLKDIVLTLCIIFFATNALLTIWIYQSIVRPLNILRLATTQIGNGILNEPIPVIGSDEIGQLCADFDNMRIRLKEIINQQLHTEENLQEILSNLSHDLKTPITAIKGYTEGILDGVADTKEKQQRYLQTIYAKSNDISYLIDELSIYAKIEQNVVTYNFIPVNLDKYFIDCIDYFQLDLEQDSISIDYQNNTDTDTKVLADPKQLRRVIQNIIGNAAKYNDKENGHISVRIENVPDMKARPLPRHIAEDGSDSYPEGSCDSFVRVEIKDSGPGIAAKDIPHIFDKFYRADASRTSSKRGSGLGLSIVKMIIYDHGGEVGVDSTEGEGTLFYFTLKKAAQKAAQK